MPGGTSSSCSSYQRAAIVQAASTPTLLFDASTSNIKDVDFCQACADGMIAQSIKSLLTYTCLNSAIAGKFNCLYETSASAFDSSKLNRDYSGFYIPKSGSTAMTAIFTSMAECKTSNSKYTKSALSDLSDEIISCSKFCT